MSVVVSCGNCGRSLDGPYVRGECQTCDWREASWQSRDVRIPRYLLARLVDAVGNDGLDESDVAALLQDVERVTEFRERG